MEISEKEIEDILYSIDVSSEDRLYVQLIKKGFQLGVSKYKQETKK